MEGSSKGRREHTFVHREGFLESAHWEVDRRGDITENDFRRFTYVYRLSSNSVSITVKGRERRTSDKRTDEENLLLGLQVIQHARSVSVHFD
jgi:hypothetical protein